MYGVDNTPKPASTISPKPSKYSKYSLNSKTSTSMSPNKNKNRIKYTKQHQILTKSKNDNLGKYQLSDKDDDSFDDREVIENEEKIKIYVNDDEYTDDDHNDHNDQRNKYRSSPSEPTRIDVSVSDINLDDSVNYKHKNHLDIKLNKPHKNDINDDKKKKKKRKKVKEDKKYNKNCLEPKRDSKSSKKNIQNKCLSPTSTHSNPNPSEGGRMIGTNYSKYRLFQQRKLNTNYTLFFFYVR